MRTSPLRDPAWSGKNTTRLQRQVVVRGFVLVAVLVIVMLASMVTLSLVFRVKAEQTAAAGSAGGDQAWCAAMSGVREAIRLAGRAGEDDSLWMHNPSAFRDRLVFDDVTERWFFTVYADGIEGQEVQPRFGLSDEAGKIDVNHAEESILIALPGMTRSLAHGILDFIDADSVPRPEGAEQEFYDALAKPYLIHNRPLSSIEELLLVRGVTPGLLYGEDANWNGRLDPNEDDGDAQFPADNKDGRLDAGLRHLLTVSSYEPGHDDKHGPRTNVNDPSSPMPPVELPPTLTNYIAALRRNHVRIGHPAELLEAKAALKNESGATEDMESGVGKEELPLVLEHFSAIHAARVQGLINVNTASSVVLKTVPGVDESLAETILSTRKSIGPEKRRSIAWLFQEGLVDATRFKEIAPKLTARSYQFSFRVVGYGAVSGRFRVLDVMIDVATTPPGILRIRDITKLGLPFPIASEQEPGPAKPAGNARTLPTNPARTLAGKDADHPMAKGSMITKSPEASPAHG